MPAEKAFNIVVYVDMQGPALGVAIGYSGNHEITLNKSA